MIALLVLAVIGAMAGGVGGALTNGIDGFILGSCAGFVLGVLAWITDSIAQQRAQALQPNQLFNEFDQATPLYEPPPARQQPDERHRST
jgi:hypothetical protein